MQNSMTPSSSIFPARPRDPAGEMIRKQPTLEEIEKRLGTSLELPGDFERVRELAHELGNLAQKSRLANFFSDPKPAAPKAPTQGVKKSWPPDFDDSIQWVGRTI